MDFAQFKKGCGLELDPQQEKAVQTVDGPVLLLAVPGSGKTTVLVTRIGYMLHMKYIDPAKILTMTYTVAAARDMRQRYASFFGEEEADLLEFRTINGVCSRIIRRYETMLGRTAFRLLEDGKQQAAIVAELCRSQTREFVSEGTVKAVQTAITYVKNMMLTDAEVDKVEVEGVEFPAIYRGYCKVLQERGLMDYDDQMVYALRILKKYPRILEAVQNRYEYFCVDEAQDTSKIQHHIIRLLAGRSRNLFMVGDEDQSIYGFRAAYPQALTEFEQVYPDATVLYMEQNYRSVEEIVAVADKFIQKNKNRHPKHIRATRPASGYKPREIEVFDRRRQYRYLCKVAGNCKGETAVLYRDNDSALPLIDLLDREKIPYRCRQVDSLFFTSRIVRDISDIIELARDPADGDRFMNIYYKLGAGISKAIAQQAVNECNYTGAGILEYIGNLTGASGFTKKQCRALRTHMANLLTEEADKAVFRIVNYMGYGDYLKERDMDTSRLDILEALAADQPDVEHLLDRLDRLRTVVQGGSTGGPDCPFILSTIHSSKGLEYDRVILMDVADGLLPNAVADEKAGQEEKDAYEEERRLFYVGMTRAKNSLAMFTFKRAGLHSTFTGELFPRRQAKPTPARKPVPKPRTQLSTAAVTAMSGDYNVGTRLVHKSFGPGTLSSHTGDIVTITFDSGADKRLSLSTALKMGLVKLAD